MALAPKVARVGVYALASRIPVDAVRKLNEAIAGGHLLYRNPDLFLSNETEPFDIVVVDATHPKAEQIIAVYEVKKLKVLRIGKSKPGSEDADKQSGSEANSDQGKQTGPEGKDKKG